MSINHIFTMRLIDVFNKCPSFSRGTQKRDTRKIKSYLLKHFDKEDVEDITLNKDYGLGFTDARNCIYEDMKKLVQEEKRFDMEKNTIYYYEYDVNEHKLSQYSYSCEDTGDGIYRVMFNLKADRYSYVFEKDIDSIELHNNGEAETIAMCSFRNEISVISSEMYAFLYSNIKRKRAELEHLESILADFTIDKIEKSEAKI